jgi:ABC-2 type transport system ATP-binding protein
VTAALELQGLVKRFGDAIAVDHLDLTVPQGSWYGLVGPNGAGKTTSLSMAVGLLRPDSGTARVLDVDVWDRPDEAKALLGVLPSGRSLPARLTGPELLTYLGLLRGLEPDVVEARSAELVRALDLDDARRTLLADCSTGTRRKFGLAAAVLHDPRVLVLDEPFEAVDPVSAASIREILGRYVERGGTVLMSSHVMALVEQTCDHVAVVDAGRVVAAGTLDGVRGAGSLEAAFAELVGVGALPAGTLTWLGG